MVPEKMFENMDALIGKLHEQIALYKQLKRALMLANVIGVPPKEIKGKLRASVRNYGRPLYNKPWMQDELVVELDGVEVARKRLIDVPLDLWPEPIRAEYERVQRRTKSAVMRTA
jgi:hypothetical protein